MGGWAAFPPPLATYACSKKIVQFQAGYVTYQDSFLVVGGMNFNTYLVRSHYFFQKKRKETISSFFPIACKNEIYQYTSAGGWVLRNERLSEQRCSFAMVLVDESSVVC